MSIDCAIAPSTPRPLGRAAETQDVDVSRAKIVIYGKRHGRQREGRRGKQSGKEPLGLEALPQRRKSCHVGSVDPTTFRRRDCPAPNATFQ